MIFIKNLSGSFRPSVQDSPSKCPDLTVELSSILGNHERLRGDLQSFGPTSKFATFFCVVTPRHLTVQHFPSKKFALKGQNSTNVRYFPSEN